MNYATRYVKEQAQSYLNSFHDSVASMPSNIAATFKHHNQAIQSDAAIHEQDKANHNQVAKEVKKQGLDNTRLVSKQTQQDAKTIISGGGSDMNNRKTQLEQKTSTIEKTIHKEVKED